MEDKLFALSDLSLVHENFTVLSQINLEIRKGETVFFLGTSGSGKSTLLKLLAGLKMPTSGDFLFLGQPFSPLSNNEILEARKKTGFVFQDSALWANMSIYQNLALPLNNVYPEITKEKLDAKIKQFMTEFLFDDDLMLRPAQISTGEKKIVSFIRGVITNPDVLFLDEPTNSVDPSVKERIRKHLKKLKSEGKTILVVTHDPDMTSQLADRLIVLKAGKIIADGPFREVTRSKDRDVTEALSEVLSQTATYDEDILGLLDDGANPFDMDS